MTCPDCQGTRRTFWAAAGMMQDCQTCSGPQKPSAQVEPTSPAVFGHLALYQSPVRECDYPGYSRVAILRGGTAWTLRDDGYLVNQETLVWPQVVTGSQTVWGFGLWVGRRLIGPGAMDHSFVLHSGVTAWVLRGNHAIELPPEDQLDWSR